MSDFDSEISELQKQEQALMVRMESAAASFRESVTSFLVSFYEERTKQEVTLQTDLTGRLGKAKLSELKQELSNLQESASTIVEELIGPDSLWWHKSDEVKSREHVYYSHVGNSPPEVLNKPVRQAAGKLAPLLEKYGYLPTSGERMWRERDRNTSYTPTSARPCYPNFLEWSPQMKARITDYDKLLNEARSLSHRVSSLQRKKREKQATDLWDSA